MTNAAASTMAEVEIWRLQAHITQEVVGVNVKGLTHEDSLVQPEPDGNCLNWVLGHLLSVYEEVHQLLGQEPVMGKAALKHYVRGSDPIRDRAEAIDFEKLMTAWNDSSKRVDAGLAGLTPEVLDRPVPHSPSGNPDETVRSLLTTVMFHQAYHAGQTGVLRRIAGKEGAIR